MVQQEIRQFEAQEKLGKLLGSQRAFISFPQPAQIDPLKPQTIFMKCLTGGWGSGKTRAMIINGLMLSAAFPMNEGLIGTYHGRDLEITVIPLFFEVTPPSWIKSVRERGKTGMTVTLMNGSKIYFKHIHDAGAGATQTRRVGANLGWAGLDQIEMMKVDHINSIMGRLRNPRAKIKMLLATANPNGRDWHQKMFFPNWQPLDTQGDVFFKTYQTGNIFGVHVNSEENRISNGGFVEDDYFDNIIQNQPPDWVARYIHGSFEDFTGKVFKGYTLDSPHNIDRISIPSHWECLIPIDVGGSGNWGVPIMYVDEQGNLIVTDGFNQATGRTEEVANWIKQRAPWNDNRTTFVIDPENFPVATEFSDLGIYTRKAEKSVHPGMLRTLSYFHLRQNVIPPKWFLETQTPQAIERAKKFGVPRIFVFKNVVGWRTEHDTVVWDEKKPNHIKKDAKTRFDFVDATRYGIMTRPEASKLPQFDKYKELRLQDPLSAREAEAMDKRIASYIQNQRGGNTQEMFFDGEIHPLLQIGRNQRWEME